MEDGAEDRIEGAVVDKHSKRKKKNKEKKKCIPEGEKCSMCLERLREKESVGNWRKPQANSGSRWSLGEVPGR